MDKNWSAQNTKGILASVKRVLASGDCTKLTKDAYIHITLHMGFIAHYSRAGFCDVYKDTEKLRHRLLTSEMSDSPMTNDYDADRYMRNPWFQREYGTEYCQSVVDCNQGIVQLARN
ncbi:hypothetical protein LCGC14_0355920 [marine sediment metagenome]|uniref:Uncharacterized protein n=1 Tax=marine sediment metagenome TaxID=412755 RepID=A0A0F9T9H2_9ZZZZ